MNGWRELLGTTPCACGACGTIATRTVTIDDDLIPPLLAAAGGRAVDLVADDDTLAACGRELLQGLRANGAEVRSLSLSVDGRPPHADGATVSELERWFAPAGERLAVAVGSGTLNDLVKAASAGLRRRYACVPTAPSMNGYTSAVAAITVGGLKSTLPAPPPFAVLASPRVLADSPRRMAVAGLADLLSKPVSTADWKLGHLLWDEPYCSTPAGLAGEAVEAAVAVAGDLHRPAGARVLFEALLLSGISMGVAGTSSPASGGEHLISHFLDMTAGASPAPGGRTPALHGEQVGVATRITTRLYAALMELDPGTFDWAAAAAQATDAATIGAELRRAPWLPDRLRRRFEEEGGRKLRRLGGPAERVRRVERRWSAIVGGLEREVETAGRYARVLPNTEAPLTALALGIAEPEELRAAYRLARFVRDRYTVLDLAGDLGLLETLEERALAGL